MSVIKRQRVDQQSLTGHKSSVLYDSVLSLEGHEGPVHTVKFNSSGQFIASGGADRKILLWDLPTKELYENNKGKLGPDVNGRIEDLEGVFSLNYGVIEGHKSAITSLRWTVDSSSIITSSADTTVGIWDAETGKRIRKCSLHSLCVNEVDVTGESTIVSCGDDGTVNVWDQREKKPTGSIDTKYPLTTVCFDSAGMRVFTSGIDPTVLAYDIRDLSKPTFSVESHGEPTTSLTRNQDDSALVVRSMDGQIRTINAREYIPLNVSREGTQIFEGALSGKEQLLIRVSMNKSGTEICTGSEDNSVITWEYATRRVTGKYTGHSSTVVDTDYHPDGNMLLSSSTDGSVIIRELI